MSLLSRLAVQAARAYGILSSDKNRVSADYLVVAGGGGAGDNLGGAGGAGGLLTSTATLSTLNTYSITVGAGGLGATSSGANGSNGSNSVISGTGLSTITAIGGGGGAGDGPSGGGTGTAQSGGSGGGGASASGNAGGAGTSGQGNNGGSSPAGTYRTASSGGGGAGTAGSGRSSTADNGGNGGNGTASSISGSSVTYAGGGGGGGASAAGTGGTGGGGNGKTGTNVAGDNGTVNLGGGGGGGSPGGGDGGSGGSGIVIISYTSATPKFVGGTITTSGGKQIHTFTSSGTLSPITPITASYLVVAGGGGGGAERNGGGAGGGGAGGYQTSSTTLYSGATYVVTVGGGGAGAAAANPANSGTQGSNSVLSGTGITTITSTGGGFGGAQSTSTVGGNGGSGGGGWSGGLGAPYAGGTGTSGQGNNGGSGNITGNAGGGGGGGASAVGGSWSGTNGSNNGGAGTASSITGTSVTYAGGGGGGVGAGTASTGGTGGGGAGGVGAGGHGTSGTPNLGGGGGGAGGNNVTPGAGGSGGSGVVIISYAGSQVFNGGLVTTSGGNTIHTFTSTGALTPLTNNLNNSLRFRRSATAYLSRTPTATGNQQKFTWSAWVKRGALNADYRMFEAGTAGTGEAGIQFYGATSNDSIEIYYYAGSYQWRLNTTALYRDPSAWYHIVWAMDTTQANASDRIKLYVNGNQVTAFTTATYPTQNSNTIFNTSGTVNYFGAVGGDTANCFDGYLADVNFIDGQALEPYYFGNNDANGVWKPIQYKGTYGTNGFYLTFGNTTSTTTLGYDSSPNGNNWTCNNISLTAGSTYDAMLDVPTNTSATVANYCVMNPLGNAVGNAPATLSEANLTCKNTATSYLGALGTIGLPTSGKFYWEVQLTQNSGSSNLSTFGIAPSNIPLTGNQSGYANSVQWYIGNNNIIQLPTGSSVTAVSGGSTTSDVFQICYDGSTGKVYLGRNNTFYNSAGSATGNPSSGTNETTTLTTGDLLPWFFAYQEGATFNFGQRPFTYTPPTGYVALNTYNLPTPTILQGNKYMDATLYTGNGGTLSVTNAASFQPDMVWVKGRSNSGTNNLVTDVLRGNKGLFTNLTDADSSTRYCTLLSNGFQFVGTAGDDGNTSGWTYVGWQWKTNGAGSSNTSGSITSTVSVNTTAGFSIVTYTGTGANATVGHGLGVAPKMVILKGRSTTFDWMVYHTSLGNTNYLRLNQTNASAASISAFNNTSPTSTVFSLGDGSLGNQASATQVAYCWAEIAGFSKISSYTGNGSSDGPFVFTNFRPKYILVKSTGIASWFVIDTARLGYNSTNNYLLPNASTAETTYNGVDILSNGFKVRNTDSGYNDSGVTYIYAAFAEHPTKISNAR